MTTKRDAKCDIIIPVWNNLSYTKDCVENIAKNTECPYRLILVDNASANDTKHYLEGLKKDRSIDVELIRNEENLGYIKAINQGLAISAAPYVVMMNNDTIAAPGWLERMIDFAQSHPDVGLINPQCNGHGNIPVATYARSLEKRKGQYMEMNQCQGFCMLVKREIIDKIGSLDEAFGIGGYDDTDYSMRAHKAGYRSVAIADSYVYHREHASFDKAGNREEWVQRNQKIYYGKWGKHLRLGATVSLKEIDPKPVSDMVKFVYGLAREWSWVHLWINYPGDAKTLEKAINDCMKTEGLTPHQNIRIDYFNLPDAVYDLALSGKLIERIRKRMAAKRFDAIISLSGDTPKVLSALAKVLKVRLVASPLADGASNKLEEGRRTAIEIKESRDKGAK
jgi:GT2 family glycosyltransferase